MKKIICTGLLLTSLVFSCKKKDSTDTNPTTTQKVASKEVAKGKLDNSKSNFSSDVKNLTNTDGIKALAHFSSLTNSSDPFGEDNIARKKSKRRAVRVAKKHAVGLLNVFSKGSENARVASDFVFAEEVGTYTWNSSTSDFNVVKGGSNIILMFPSSEEITTNDAKLTIDALTINADDNPTKVISKLELSGLKVASLNFSATYGQSMPTYLSLTLMISPYNFNLTFKENADVSKANWSLSEGSKNLSSGDVNIAYYDRALDSVKSVIGNISYLDIKVVGNIQNDPSMNNLPDGEEPTAAQLNEFMKIHLEDVTTGDKLADVKFVEKTVENEKQIDALLVYADGTTESAEDFFADLEQDLEDLIAEFDNEEESSNNVRK